MAATGSALLRLSSLPRAHHKSSPRCASESPPAADLVGRRRSLVLLTASTVLLPAVELRARAQDIPLFGLRKKLEKVEEEAEVALKKGFEKAEKGIETAERGIVAAKRGIEEAEREIVMAEEEIEAAVSFGGLAQAGVVAGAEFVGVVVASSVVNGIIGSEDRKS